MSSLSQGSKTMLQDAVTQISMSHTASVIQLQGAGEEAVLPS